MLTTAQLQTLKAAIAAETDPDFVAARTNGQTSLMADFYNAASTGTGTTADPGTLVFEGPISDAHISAALEL